MLHVALIVMLLLLNKSFLISLFLRKIFSSIPYPMWNECFPGKLEVFPAVDKMRETCSRRFGRAREAIDAPSGVIGC